jgi:hypothetical protein
VARTSKHHDSQVMISNPWVGGWAKENIVDKALEGGECTDQRPLASVALCQSTSVKKGNLVKRREVSDREVRLLRRWSNCQALGRPNAHHPFVCPAHLNV